MDHEEKIRRLEALLPAEADDPLTHFLLGREYMEAGRIHDAARVLARCVELNPRYTAAWRFLGDCHRHSGQNAQSASVYERGIAVASETGDLQAGREMEALLRKVRPTP